jgi:predicted AlkP superfamily phosphohydrolase/phosphomutase
MTSRSPILFVGLDACDPAIARGFAAAGRLPTLARLFAKAARAKVRNPFGLFVGALWTTFATGLRPDRHRFHCWDEIDVATYVRRLTSPPAGNETTFWRKLSDADRRVAVIDVPHSVADAPINGMQVVEWGCHDRHFGLHTWPPRAAAEIAAAFGLHPVLGMDAYAKREFAPDDYAHRAGAHRTVEENRALFEGLRHGAGMKRAMASALLAEGGWDLFLVVFGESHSIGHQQWHLHDGAHPRFDAAALHAVGGDPLQRVYEELDGALGELLAHVADDTSVLVLLSHGMGPHHDGTHLLDEVLGRIDLFDRDPPARAGSLDVLRRTAGLLPGAVQRRITAFAVPAVRRRARSRDLAPCPEFASAQARAHQRFFLEPNNYVYGGVRLNLAGREPNGCVDPDEADQVCARLARDLLALINVESGRPVIHAVHRADRWYRRAPDDTIPDLFIDWERSGPIETVWSAKTGIVHAPYTNWRSGDHRPDGLLLALGPDIPSNTALPDLNLEDLAPSITARLAVTLEDVDGRVVPWLSGHP